MQYPYQRDAHGLIIATESINVEDPWAVRPSIRHTGHFYFFNKGTLESRWSLASEILGILPSPSARSVADCSQQNSTASEPRPDSTGNEHEEGREVTLLSEPSAAPFKVVDGLGHGGYGVVVEVEHTVSRRRFAMKVVRKAALLNRRDRQRLELELNIMNKIKPSPFIQQCHGMFETVCSVCMVLDLHRGNDLFHHLMLRLQERKNGFSENEAVVLLAELTLALEHMHVEGFVHCDVKAENVMLDAEGHVKLIDFGLACELVDDVIPMSPTGTLAYMAPELVSEHAGGRHTDWWAVGVMAFEMLRGCGPWSSSTSMMAMKRDITSNREISPPTSISPEASDFICSLLRKDYRRRLGSFSDSEVKDALFFSAVDWERMATQGSPPAFVPDAALCVSTEDRASAMDKYVDFLDEQYEPRERHITTVTLPTMGLRLVAELPSEIEGVVQEEEGPREPCAAAMIEPAPL